MCGCIFEKRKFGCRMKICKPCNSKRVKSQTPEKRMWQRAKQRARAKGMESTLEVEDIFLPKVCPILGIELKVNSGRPGAYDSSYSLDRIDNSKGYTQDNIQVISQIANAMKANASAEQLLLFAKYILKTYEETGED